MNENIPVYLQIRNMVVEKIQNGTYTTGDKIPSEWDLVKKYNVSRMTARKAITGLVKQGFAEVRPGKGTFVTEKIIKKNLSTFSGFSSNLLDQGAKKVQSEILNFSIEEADKQTAEILNIFIGTPVYLLDRIRLVDDMIIAVEYSRMPASLFPGLIDFDFSKLSLYSTLREKYNYSVYSGKQLLSIALCDEERSNLLQVKKGDPLFRMESFSYDKKELIFEYCESFYRQDHCVFTTTIQNINE